MQNMNMLKKITVATVCGRISKPKNDEVIKLMTVIGRAWDTKSGTTQLGDWIGLVGEFRAVRHDTGEMFASQVAILPDIAQAGAVAAVSSMDGGAVDFAVEIGVKKSTREGAAVDYEYTASFLYDDSHVDQLADLTARFLPSAEQGKLEDAKKPKRAPAGK